MMQFVRYLWNDAHIYFWRLFISTYIYFALWLCVVCVFSSSNPIQWNNVNYGVRKSSMSGRCIATTGYLRH